MTEQKKKRTYHSDMLGLPPLKMVLVHAENDRRNAATRPIQKPRATSMPRSKQEAVLKIIEHLKSKQQ